MLDEHDDPPGPRAGRSRRGGAPSPARRRFGRALIAAGTAGALVAALGALAGCGREGTRTAGFRSMDITGAEFGRDFALVDPDGRTRTLAEFRGRAVLLFFGFTQCPDVCPTTLARASEVMQRLGADADRVQVIFITVDPERDTPELLREYTKTFDPRFLGLRGDLAATEATAREFKVFYRKVPTGSTYTMDHTALSFAYDTAGRLRLAVAHGADAEQVAADLKLLLAEAS
ncbi:MAG: SCO family protein [Burkholderiales bacterium]|nr:SCO family protein [Burkholderiales bacterium]